MNNQAMRLYKAVERLALQAGEDTDEAIDWLCGEHGGMFKLYEAYFSPKKPDGTCPTCKCKLTNPLTDEQIEDEWEKETGHSIFGGDRSLGRPMYISPDEVVSFVRNIEAAHGIKE